MFADTTYISSNVDLFHHNSHVTMQVKAIKPSLTTSASRKEVWQLLTDRYLKLYHDKITHSAVLMSRVNPVYIVPELKSFGDNNIPNSSPLYPLQNLELGWDGYWADPLSQEVVLKAHQLWNDIERITKDKKDLPTISPTANGSIAFSWTRHYPRKELEVSLIDQTSFLCEWLLSHKDKDIESTSTSKSNLLKVIKEYMEL